MNRLQLPSPNKWVVSPLKKYEIAKITRRRKIKKWSNFEDWYDIWDLKGGDGSGGEVAVQRREEMVSEENWRLTKMELKVIKV
ncbi:hypothetical protein LguiA_014697 [Lonicera macranthoides]